jgi:hypothetical protein
LACLNHRLFPFCFGPRWNALSTAFRVIAPFFVDLKNGSVADAARHIVHHFIALFVGDLMRRDVTALQQIAGHKMPSVRPDTNIAPYPDLAL